MTGPPPSGAARSRRPRDPRGAPRPLPAAGRALPAPPWLPLPAFRRPGPEPGPPSAAGAAGPGRAPRPPLTCREEADRGDGGRRRPGRAGLSAPPGSAPPLPAALVQGRAALPSLPPGSGRHAPQGSGGEAGRDRTGPGHKGSGGRWPREPARSGGRAKGAR